jgi:hypothetical protein
MANNNNSKKLQFAWLYCLMLCGATMSNFAHADTEEDGKFWFSFGAQGSLPAENWHWNFDLQPRFREEGQHLDQLFIRPSVYYQIDPKSSIWLGYDRVNIHPAGKSAFVEQRLWPQYSYRFDPIADITFSSRTRFELRRSELGSDTGYRLRQMLRASYPLGSHFAAVAFDELFIDLNQTDWGVFRGIDQNRAFVGLDWIPNPGATLEVGYLNQFINTRNIDRENHVLSTSLKFNF